jgi:hypothetical protein
MPALPWTSFLEPQPDQEYVVMASQLPLTRYRHIPSFLVATSAIREQLARTEGLIGYSLDAHPLRKTFLTLSAWADRAALDRFSRADPHWARVNGIRSWMQPTTFTFWTARGSQFPLRWDDARRRLADAGAS